MIHSPSRLLLIGLIGLAGACSEGESAPTPEGATGLDRAAAREPVEAPFTLVGGTRLEAALNDDISSKSGVAGDIFSATLAREIVGADGRVAIPTGSIVRGTIVEVAPAPNDRSTGTLTLAVSSMTVRGQDYPISASIDSLMTVQEGRGLERADVIRVAGGAAAGSIIGQVVGHDTKSTVIGGVIGAAAGGVVSVLVKDEDIVLPAGARLMLTLLEPIEVRAGQG